MDTFCPILLPLCVVLNAWAEMGNSVLNSENGFWGGLKKRVFIYPPHPSEAAGVICEQGSEYSDALSQRARAREHSLWQE